MCVPKEKAQGVKKPEPSTAKNMQMSEGPAVDDNTQSDQKTAQSFRRHWCQATDDYNLTLYGFRRFRTAHLINLRFLEQEIDEIDHQIFQAGMKLNRSPSAIDRLGLRHGKRDVNARSVDEVINQELILRLRELLRKYGTYVL